LQDVSARNRRKKEKVKVNPISVVACQPFIADIVLSTTLTGTIKAGKEAAINSKIPGKISNILVKEGDFVKKGQIVVRLDSTDIEIGLKQAEAGLATAKAGLLSQEANYKNSKREFERMEKIEGIRVCNISKLR